MAGKAPKPQPQSLAPRIITDFRNQLIKLSDFRLTGGVGASATGNFRASAAFLSDLTRRRYTEHWTDPSYLNVDASDRSSMVEASQKSVVAQGPKYVTPKTYQTHFLSHTEASITTK